MWKLLKWWLKDRKERTMMNAWIQQVKDAGFNPDIFFSHDGDAMIVLQGLTPTTEKIKLFRDIDPDRCMATALQYALNYDAYVTNAALCSVRH
jgi:hypothetical protein